MGGVTGRVTDASNNGLSKVMVTVAGTNTGVVTNAAGEYAISGLAGGTYRLNVRRIGYEPIDRDITVTPGQYWLTWLKSRPLTRAMGDLHDWLLQQAEASN